MATSVVRNGESCSKVLLNGRDEPEWESIEQQDDPSRQEAAVRRRTRWSYEKNVAVMECYFKSRPVGDDGRPEEVIERDWRRCGDRKDTKIQSSGFATRLERLRRMVG